MNYHKKIYIFATFLSFNFMAHVSNIHASDYSTLHVTGQISSFAYVVAKYSAKQRLCDAHTQFKNVEWKSPRWPAKSGRQYKDNQLICNASQENTPISIPMPSDEIRSLIFEVYADNCYDGHFQKVCTLPVSGGSISTIKSFNINVSQDPKNSFKCDLATE
ncbi:MAG TPA: hypothetical protein VMW10_05220 [Alphaproteobacteria bacterium]|nr:hypothetical protein [Alphaproteobacteria bacterium]